MSDTWPAIARDFSDYLLSSGKSPQTAYTYTKGVGQFWRWCAERETDARQIDKFGLRHWMAERRAKVSAGRVHNEFAALRQFFKMLVVDGYRDDNPTEALPPVKRGEVLPTKPVALSDFDRLLAACRNDRDRVLLMIMGYSGLRVSEVAALDAADIDWQESIITVRHGKGDKQRRVAVNPEIMGWLRSFLGMFPEGPIWRSRSRGSIGSPLAAHQLRKIIYGIGEAAGVEVHPHALRAMYGTSMIAQHGDIQALQGQMGHADITTTARYTYWTREKRGLEQSRRLTLSGG